MPAPATPDAVMAAATATWPDRPALLADGLRLSHAELDAAVERAATALLAAGARPGERVALRLEKGLAVLLAHRACLRLGVVSVPVNPRATAAELAVLLEDARPCLWVTDVEPPAGAPTVLRVDTWHDFADGGGDPTGDVAVDEDRARGAGAARRAEPRASDLPPAPAPDDLACLIYTSGTTGRPKGARLTHANLAANTAALRAAWAWSERDVLLHVLPLFHVHGLFVGVHAAWSSGACVHLRPGFDADDVWRRLGAGEASLFFGVPTHYHRLLAVRPAGGVDTSTVRLFVSGSAPLRPDVKDAFAVATGHAILERYGMTETGMITSQALDGPRPAGSVGRPLPGVALRVVGESGAVLGAELDGERATRPGSASRGGTGPRDGAPAVGEVQVRGPSVCDGYWERPEASAEALTEDGWFRTGDLGRLDGHGALWLVGRAKELILSGGFNVYPREVEAALDAHPAVHESAVAGLPDDDLGEVPVAAVVLEPGAADASDEDALRAWCRERLAAYKSPRRVVCVDALPRNAMGKVSRPAVAALFG